MPTRGTTHPNRLRRVDRWLLATRGDGLRSTALAGRRPVVVDLGFGRHPATVIELAQRLRGLDHRGAGPSSFDVVGVELDPERVAAARGIAADTADDAADDAAGGASGGAAGVRFAQGGFGVEGVTGRIDVIRAFNVLRQYPATDVAPAWAAMRARLAPGGVVVEGTCDEIGRLASWVVLEAAGNTDGRGTGARAEEPVSLVLSWRLSGLTRPGDVAARLPKALIERNVPPHAIHAFLAELDDAWHRAAPLAPFGARQRFATACRSLRTAGWPVQGERLWRQGTLEVPWAAVAG